MASSQAFQFRLSPWRGSLAEFFRKCVLLVLVLTWNAPVGWPGPIGESSLLRYRDSWIFTGRTKGPILWYRTDDLFGAHPPRTATEMPHPNSHAPHTAHLCPDGVVRLLVGDHTVSPHRNARDPLYLWDVDPDHGFRLTRRQTVFDSVAAGLSIREEAIPRVDYGNLLPHMGGRVQHLVHRVRTKAVDLPDKTRTVVNLSEKAVHGIYHARLVYDHEFPGTWQFGSPTQDPGTGNPPKKTRLYKTWPGAATGLVFADS